MAASLHGEHASRPERLEQLSHTDPICKVDSLVCEFSRANGTLDEGYIHSLTFEDSSYPMVNLPLEKT